MLQIDHRESHDIDLFLADPQLLPYLNPGTQGGNLERLPDSYSVEGNSVLKLSFSGLGEIDFICCADITDQPTRTQDIRGHNTALETPAEIIAKKVFYRGWSFTPRDMFDLAAVADRHGDRYVVDALAQAGRGACAKALGVVERAVPGFVQSVNDQLLVRDAARHLVQTAQDTSRRLLAQTLASLPPTSGG